MALPTRRGQDAWLARHRFGHMHSPAKLRGYVREHDAKLAEALSDDELLWAGSYQRRSPQCALAGRTRDLWRVCAYCFVCACFACLLRVPASRAC